jgi:uncharacterized protein (TIGR02231 family)
VTRVARLEVPAGDTRVLLAGLPAELDDDSVRVQGAGTAKARVHGVSVEVETGEDAARAEGREAEARLEKLRDEDRGLEDRIAAARARAKFVESLRSTYSEERAKNLAVRGVAAKEWADLALFVDGELTRAGEDVRRAEAGRRDLARRIAAAEAALAQVQAKLGRSTKTVAVELSAERPGALELSVAYTVPSAGWQPVWDARLDPEAGKVELAFQGSVWQRTGEDWKDVRLSVSTAQPARGLAVPELQPVYLRKVEPVAQWRGERAAKSAPAAAPSAPARELADLAAAPEEELELASAEVEEGLLAATFTAPRRESVDGAGKARAVPLSRFPLEAEVSRVAAPRAQAATFLAAKAVNATGFPLLPGTAGVWVGDLFVGRTALPATPPGGELELAFGVDERVEVERTVLERKRDQAGIVSRDEVMRYRVRIAVKNRYAQPVKVRLLDLVPVSRDGQIQVKLQDGTTPATREDPERPGVREWDLALGAREERVIDLRYEVRWPKGFPIAGLE